MSKNRWSTTSPSNQHQVVVPTTTSQGGHHKPQATSAVSVSPQATTSTRPHHIRISINHNFHHNFKLCWRRWWRHNERRKQQPAAAAGVQLTTWPTYHMDETTTWPTTAWGRFNQSERKTTRLLVSLKHAQEYTKVSVGSRSSSRMCVCNFIGKFTLG